MSDFLEITKFNVKQLDEEGKAVLEEFEERFIELRKKQCYIPPEYYQMATAFHLASCRAQCEVQQATMKHFTDELRKSQKTGAEVNSVLNWQKRRKFKETFIAEQRKLKKPLPWRYDFWGNLTNVFKSVLEFFIPAGVVRLFIRKPKVMARTTNAPEPEIKPTDAPEPAPVYLLTYSGNCEPVTTNELSSKDLRVPSENKEEDRERILPHSIIRIPDFPSYIDSSDSNNRAHVAASADISASAVVDSNRSEIKPDPAKPSPTPASQSAKGSVSRKSLIGRK